MTQNDKKTELTFKTIEKLKASSIIFGEFLKCASTYQKQCQKLSEEGKKMCEALQRVANLTGGDIADALTKLVETERSIENKRDTLARILQDDFIIALQKSAKPEESELNQFESEYKKARSSARQNIAKLETQTKKAGKKGTETLQQAIQQLNEEIKKSGSDESRKTEKCPTSGKEEILQLFESVVTRAHHTD